MKAIAKIIRKILYYILNIIKFPSIKKYESEEINNLNKIYKKKQLHKVQNKFTIDKNVDLTIIVPVYNAEKLLKKCIVSLINQKTKYKYNIVFINDGSTDTSLNILRDYEKKTKNIKVLTQLNKGIAESRNIGIKNIKGKYVSFIDSDDFITEDFVEVLLDTAYKNDSDIVRCNYFEYDIDRDMIIKSGKDQPNKNFQNSLGEEILNYKGYPWGGIFKSELWNNVQFPNGYWYEDMIIRMILFRKAKKFSYINNKLYYYCLHSNNISKSIEKTTDIRCLDHYYLVKGLIDLSNELGLVSDEALKKNILYEYGVILWLRTRKIPKKLRKSIFYDACKLINLLNYSKVENKDEKIIIDSFKRRDYIKWNLYALYKMLGVKYGKE